MCTRVFWSDNSVAKVASRTMDWQVSDEPAPVGRARGHEESSGRHDLGVTIRCRGTQHVGAAARPTP